MAIHFLAVVRPGSPEEDTVNNAASEFGARVTLMTSDSADIDALVRSTAKTPVAVSAAGEGTHWAEAGWWLVPLLALLVLSGFRRESNSATPEVAS